jgi:thiamine-monophosphate kinase
VADGRCHAAPGDAAGAAADEFALIDLILAQQPLLDTTVRVGPGDDAAVLLPPPGHDLVCSVDTLIEGVHFLPDTPPALATQRALAVNLSDLAAMGARPGPCLLALTHPELSPAIAAAVGRGFAIAARGTGAQLVGGNLARGPFTLSVTVNGWVPAGAALLRCGARPGDLVCLSGSVGGAGEALASLRAAPARLASLEGEVPAALRRYLTPTPRLALGIALRGLATACIDVSDGLLADAAQLARASGVRLELALERVPFAGAREAALVAGDDYELLFTIPEEAASRLEALAAELALPLTAIGRVTEGRGLALEDLGRSIAAPARLGWNHFA